MIMVMFTNLLGKIMFPRRPRWQRERDARALLVASLVALVVAGVIGSVMVWRSFSSKF